MCDFDDVHLWTGRLDQSMPAAETLVQLTSAVERKRHTLKSLLRRELRAVEEDAVAAQDRGKRNARGNRARSKEDEAKLAARLYARSQVCALLDLFG